MQLRLPTGQCSIKVLNSHFDNLTRLFRHLGDPSPLPSSSPCQLPNLFSHPCLLFLSLPHVFLALLLPHVYAYIILILATFHLPRYLYQYPLHIIFPEAHIFCSTKCTLSSSPPLSCLRHVCRRRRFLPGPPLSAPLLTGRPAEGRRLSRRRSRHGGLFRPLQPGASQGQAGAKRSRGIKTWRPKNEISFAGRCSALD